MTVDIIIHLGYPDVIPTFTFMQDGKAIMGVDADTIAQHYKEMERVICQQPKELIKRFSTSASGGNPAMLLSYQLVKCLACADVFFTAVRAGPDKTVDAVSIRLL